MANLFKKTYSWLKSPTKNTHFQFSIILFCVATIGFQAGTQHEIYNLSKEPEAALTALIYKKCLNSVNVTKNIRDPWSMEYMDCMREGFADIRNEAFKTEMYFKAGIYTHECDIKNEDKRKCLHDIESIYKKRLAKYHELESLMN